MAAGFEDSPFARFSMHGAAPAGDCDEVGSGVDSSTCLAAGRAHHSALFHELPIRFGEADNPGPRTPTKVHIGVTNPSWLRTKEAICLDHEVGILGLCETQLSVHTQRTCSAQLERLAGDNGRLLRVHMGAPVAVRTTSTWAGGWAGVCTLSDYPSQSLQLPWQGMEFSSGRMMASQHFIHGHPLTHVCLYGYPRSPTWPRASWLTQQLLDVVTNEIVIGASGCRVVVGDFNHGPQALAHFDTWRAYGWRSAQDWARCLVSLFR